MNVSEQARQGYAPTQFPVRTPRSIEAQLVGRVTARLRKANENASDIAALATAIHENRQILAQVFYSQTGGQIIENDRILPNRYVKLQGSMVLKRSRKTSVQFGVFQTVAGRNIVQEKGVFAAVWRRY